jgi:hypothetical protein
VNGKGQQAHQKTTTETTIKGAIWAVQREAKTVIRMQATVLPTVSLFSRCLPDCTYICNDNVIELGPILAYLASLITVYDPLRIRPHDNCFNYAIIMPGRVGNVSVPSKPKRQYLLCTLRKQPLNEF